MSTVKTLQIVSTSSIDTERIGRQLGQHLKGGEVIELASDLGGGKTTFVRGLASGAGSTDAVSSPTFTISKVYNAPSFDIHHFDFYRLADAGLTANELQDILDDPTNVVVIEWATLVEKVLPEERLSIVIKRTGEDTRILEVKCSESLSYLLVPNP